VCARGSNWASTRAPSTAPFTSEHHVAWARRRAARHFLEAGVDPAGQKEALRRINADDV